MKVRREDAIMCVWAHVCTFALVYEYNFITGYACQYLVFHYSLVETMSISSIICNPFFKLQT